MICRIRTTPTLSLVTVLAFAVSASCGKEKEISLDKITLPDGFEISVFAEDVPGARMMALGDKGTVFVGSMSKRVHAVVDSDGDFKADKVHVVADDLFMPNGVAFRNGSLYIAEVNQVHRLDGIEPRLEDPPPLVKVGDPFPKIRHHGWKFIGFGPDGYLYVPVGAPCNICESKEEIFASIARMKPDGSGREIYAHGVRNTVGFDWHPETGELWFTDNGRDWLGDDSPPDELNRAPKGGLHFGYPYCHGSDTQDPDFGDGRKCSELTPPARELGPHVAAIGMRFYTGKQFPAAYRNQVFIAEHGSWNRSTKIGYRVSLVRVERDKAVSYEAFAEGWLQGEKAWGRPSDLLVLGDGSILVSDDLNGTIYRIAYTGKKAKPAESPASGDGGH